MQSRHFGFIELFELFKIHMQHFRTIHLIVLNVLGGSKEKVGNHCITALNAEESGRSCRVIG